jgi:homoserine kinase
VKRVRVKVPASSANLGSGFDCLGVALGLYHTVTVEEHAGNGLEIRVSGEGEDAIPVDESYATHKAMLEAFRITGYHPARLVIESINQIPVSAGLGSCAASVLAGMGAAILLSGQELDRNQLMQLAVGVEGHPDNVAAALFGGVAVVCQSESGLQHICLQVPAEIAVTVALPDFPMSTRESRGALPDVVPLVDAVHNLSRVTLLVAALATPRLELLEMAMQDRLHQPHRADLVPGLKEVCSAAVDSGALGAALSGSGPSVMALVRQGDGAPGAAMQAEWARRGIPARVLDLPIDRAGLQFESEHFS